MKHILKGFIDTREVMLDGVYLSPKRSQKVFNHSPDGFNWGYSGSGPAQLALAVCLMIMPKTEAVMRYQTFKREFIAALPQNDNFEIEFEIDAEPEKAYDPNNPDHERP